MDRKRKNKILVVVVLTLLLVIAFVSEIVFRSFVETISPVGFLGYTNEQVSVMFWIEITAVVSLIIVGFGTLVIKPKRQSYRSQSLSSSARTRRNNTVSHLGI